MSKGARSGQRRLSTRLLTTYALWFLVLIALMGWFIERSARTALLEDLTNNLERSALLAAESLPEDDADLQRWAETMFDVGEFRSTVIRTDGVVLADSHSDPAVMEDHLDRPEVMEAMGGDVGSDIRVSVSTGFEQLYVAVPPVGVRVVRVSVATRAIEEELSTVRGSVILASVLAGLAGIGVVAVVARRMASPIVELTDQSRLVAAGDLDVSPRRSSVLEYDQLGLAISTMAGNLGQRAVDAERATEYLEVMLGALDQGTVLFGADEHAIYANEPAKLLLGVIPKDLAGLSPFQCQAVIREAMETGRPVDREFDHGRPVRRLHARAIPFVDDERTLLVIEDITAQERTAAVRRDFVANASHELKTPVTTIIASTEALQIAVKRGDPSAAKFAQQIAASGHQLDSLVTDLLDLSRLEREAPDLAPVRLNLLVKAEVERLRERAEAEDLDLRSVVEEVVVMGSHRDLSIAVRNLLDNAVRYTGPAGSIVVQLGTLDGEAVLSIEDSGEGIPTRDLDRVFERFYRVDSGRSRSTGGTGLGLAITKHVVESHGGSISVQSVLGIGTTFTIRLPESV
jgi:two-component system phosphate regulon sensor histidine kinase PhoR